MCSRIQGVISKASNAVGGDWSQATTDVQLPSQLSVTC